MYYFAIIGDMIDSKVMSNRYEHQKNLKNCLNKLNDDYQSVIISKFSITLGDEFQGLLAIEAPVFQIIDEINLSLENMSFRFGLGFGEIFTEINPELSLGADGPAYWFARDAINYIHQKNDYGNTQLAVRLADSSAQELVNSLLSASEAIKSNWRESQEILLKTLVHLKIYEEQFDQQLLGEALNLSSSALSKRLKSSSLKVYLRARHSALNLLQTLGGEMDAEKSS